eukprot:COSAG02_NODE_6596_length_3471_cov_1.285884_6_plen_46_part_00
MKRVAARRAQWVFHTPLHLAAELFGAESWNGHVVARVVCRQSYWR